MKKVQFVFLIFLSFVFSQIRADIKLPYLFSSGMVLQRNIDVTVWGWADPGERITVTFDGQTQKTKTNREGEWMLKLEPMQAGGPFEMKLIGKNEVVFNNVMIGDVWICSGQSNMEFSVSRALNAEKEITEAKYPDIRLFTVPNDINSKPQSNTNPAEWKDCIPENIVSFSAVGYFFGRDLYRELNVPIGLINTTWGGTIAESWTSPESIATDEDFSGKLKELQSLDIKSVNEELKKKFDRWQQDLRDLDSGYKNGEYIWAEDGIDFSGWKTMDLPALWEIRGQEGMDGVIWFSITFELPPDIAAKGAELNLGTIDDSDITWINGQLVGQIFNHYNWNRKYNLTPEVLKSGKNTVVVRVEDYGGGGGIYGDPDQLYVKSGKFFKSLAGEWKYRIGTSKLPGTPPRTTFGPNSYPTLLYNAMINPLIPYAIKGTIWYQGESNAGRAYQYRRLFPQMIRDWRNQWAQGNFPFLFVQLANFMSPKDQPSESEWAELREAQTMTLALPNTGMASAIDIGEAVDIHPKNKQEVGRRLALNALKIAYDKNVVYSGPTFDSIRIEGNKAYINFMHVGSGLDVHDPYGYVKGFAISGPDHNFHWAKAEKVNDATVVVYSDQVLNPVAVRYGWADNPSDLNLYNQEGLPADPFRTDQWNGMTFGKK